MFDNINSQIDELRKTWRDNMTSHELDIYYQKLHIINLRADQECNSFMSCHGLTESLMNSQRRTIEMEKQALERLRELEAMDGDE